MNIVIRLLLSFGTVAITAIASSYFTLSGTTGWYTLTEKAPLTPPSEWFSIIWSILYLLLALSYYIILGKPQSTQSLEAGRLFFSQLLLQIIWCFSFFHLCYTGIGIAVMLFLIWITWRMLKNFAGLNTFATVLSSPFFVWLLFALWLNISFVWINGISMEI